MERDDELAEALRRRHPVARALLRSLLSLLCSAAVIAIAIVGVYASTASEKVSLILEPFSLFLMPGFVISVLLSNYREYPPIVTIMAAASFYFVFFYTAFWWLAEHRRKRRIARLEDASSQNPQRSS